MDITCPLGTLRVQRVFCRWGISLYGSSVRGTWRGLTVGNPEYYERRALGMGTSLYVGSVGAACGGHIYWDFEIWLKGFWGGSVSLRGSSV
jgi:hypothetical protein